MAMKYFTACLVALVLLFSSSFAIAFDTDYEWYYDGNAPRDEVYSHGASYMIRDWGMRDIVDTMTVLEGSLNGYTGGSGIYVCFSLGAVIATNEDGSAVLLVPGSGADLSMTLVAMGAFADSIAYYDIVNETDEDNAVITGDDLTYGWLMAIGAAAAAALQVDVMPVIYMESDNGWTEMDQDTIFAALQVYCQLTHCYMSTAYLGVKQVARDEDYMDVVLMNLKAANNMRRRMIDLETFSSSDYSNYGIGITLYDTPNDLAVLIRDQQNAWIFWFLNDTDIDLLKGYVVMGFLMMGYDYWDYEMRLMTVGKDGSTKTVTLSEQDKKEALSYYFFYENENPDRMPSYAVRSKP